eukprot:TRINITY_DN309_c0_g1_i1.p2 TRINITY_DN309_c0_g1~~TRINITY_DN309_c0_g1_i1.p2  ORF type:complete len:130 (-),score=22.70 TRINITY_DN309_c0_g1_i1:158-547(-)
MLYMGFWATSKRASLFRTYPLSTKIKFSMLLLFSSSIFGAATLFSTLVSGFLGKMMFWLIGNMETSWEFDDIHLQIGVATTIGTAIFLFLILQSLPDREEPSAKIRSHKKLHLSASSSSLDDENLIDFD